jgi:hypothetical protein
MTGSTRLERDRIVTHLFVEELPESLIVSTVSTVSTIKATVPVGTEDGLDPLHVHCRRRG